MIEHKPGRFIARIFYAELDVLGEGAGNMLAFIYRDEPDDFWSFAMRFRYYVDNDLTRKSKDRRSGYIGQGRPGQELADVLPPIRHIFEVGGKGSFHEVIVDSADPAVLYRRLSEQPWAHFSDEGPEQE